jgi:hypothetical protein
VVQAAIWGASRRREDCRRSWGAILVSPVDFMAGIMIMTGS